MARPKTRADLVVVRSYYGRALELGVIDATSFDNLATDKEDDDL
jgi:hypothetical protein